jgi:hypothetical protein
MPNPDPGPPADATCWTLHCPGCQRTECHTHAELVDAMLKGWPTCCGNEMVLAPVPDRSADS